MRTVRHPASASSARPGPAGSTPTIEVPPEQAALGILLRVEQLARQAPALADLQQLAVNETRKLNRARQIFLIDLAVPRAPRVAAVSGVGAVDASSMMVETVTDLVRELARASGLDKSIDFVLPTYARPASELATSYPFREMLWVPLAARSGAAFAGLLQARDSAWGSADIAVSMRLAETYAHAWRALEGRRQRTRRPVRSRLLPAAVGVAVLGTLALPVSMTALAPAEVVAADPIIVAAPIDGVIEAVEVDPGQPVNPGDVLFRLNDTVLRNKVEIARREVSVGEARIKQATILAMTDVRGRHELGIAEADLDLKRAELGFASDMLGRTIVRADRGGVAVYADRKALIGRPVATGERIMEVADEAAVEVRIDVALPDAVALVPDGRVKLFMDIDPLSPRSARVVRSDYKARPGDGDILAFKTFARFDDGEKPARIGLRGTAQIYGDGTLLAVFLFRRPLAFLRQYFGL